MSRIVSLRLSDEAVELLDARAAKVGAADRSALIRSIVLRELGLSESGHAKTPPPPRIGRPMPVAGPVTIGALGPNVVEDPLPRR